MTLALAPLSVLFWAISALRRCLYRAGILRSVTLPVPVIVIGNISVGGTGKTPLVLWTFSLLREAGFRPGVIARGYGGDGQLRAVTQNNHPGEVGDEPLLLARRGVHPLFVCPDRASAARALLKAHPDCDVLISDDGLQHYRLHRDLEIAVVDAERRLGNGFLLPAGPLREPRSRLQKVDAIVCQGNPPYERSLSMELAGTQWHNLADPSVQCDSKEFAGSPAQAIAGIGNPARFFAHLRQLAIEFTGHAFPDHHPFHPRDLAFAGDDIVLMTEKDAVKCAPFAKPGWWYLPVDAQVDPALGRLILSRLHIPHGRQAP